MRRKRPGEESLLGGRRRLRTDDNTASRSRGLSHNFYLWKSQLRLSVRTRVLLSPVLPPSLRRRATRFSERFGFLFPSLHPFEHRGGSLEEAVSAAAASDKKEESAKEKKKNISRISAAAAAAAAASFWVFFLPPAALLVNYTRTHEFRTRKHPGEMLIFFMSIVRTTRLVFVR